MFSFHSNQHEGEEWGIKKEENEICWSKYFEWNNKFSLLLPNELLLHFFLTQTHVLHFSLFAIYRAQKRAAWRQARLKSLEQDALQAQIMIQSLNTDTDDLTDPTKRRTKDTLDGVEEEEVSCVMLPMPLPSTFS